MNYDLGFKEILLSTFRDSGFVKIDFMEDLIERKILKFPHYCTKLKLRKHSVEIKYFTATQILREIKLAESKDSNSGISTQRL